MKKLSNVGDAQEKQKYYDAKHEHLFRMRYAVQMYSETNPLRILKAGTNPLAN